MIPRQRLVPLALLAEPGALVVTRDAVLRPDWSPHATVRDVPAPPPGHRPLDLPGRPARTQDPPWAEGATPSARFRVVEADGRAPMLLEHRADGPLEPETVLLDPSGAALGSARTASGIGTLAVRDAAGTRVAAAGLRGRDWVLRADGGAPPVLRDAALALALVLVQLDPGE
ncbi:hypothetical protein ACFHW2_07855 [Actinomadura sp. LOL_016]|uniref:hypothetical protein n=1 Tax=unclassified Actinomadura TaxID=2626254 RepID=UPI003A804960